MPLLQLTNFSGGYATDLDSEQMQASEMLTAENCQWRNKLIKRKGSNEYASLTTYDDVLGGRRVRMNGAWTFLLALELSGSVKLYEGATTTYTEITDENSNAYTLTAATKVRFSESINQQVIAVNGVDRPTVVYHNGTKFVAQELDRYDERLRAVADWKAGQYVESGTVYTDDTTDAQDTDAADFALSTTTTNDGHYFTSDFTFTRISYNTVSGGGGSPVAAFEYWDGTTFTALSTFQQTAVWTGGNTVSEFDLPLDADGDLLWVPDTVGDEAELQNKFVIRVRFTTAPSGALLATSAAIAHTHYLTQITKDERPQAVTVHRNRPVLASGNVLQLGKINSVKGWDEFDAEYALRGGNEIRWIGSHQDYLAIVKEDAIYGLYGNSLASWRFDHLAPIGTASGDSCAVVKDILMFLGNDGLIYWWNGRQHTTTSRHIATDLGSFTHSDAVATIWDGEYWLAFPTDSVVLTADPDSFRQPENSDGEGRLSFYKFTPYKVDYFIPVVGAGETTLMLIATDRTAGAERLRRLDNGLTDQGTTAIVLDMKTKELSGGEFGVFKQVGRVKPLIDSGNGLHTIEVGNDRGVSSSRQITSLADYITPSYDIDGERIYLRITHSGTTTAGISGFAMPLTARRF